MITLLGLGAHLDPWISRPVKLGLARVVGRLIFWLVPRIRRHTISNMAIVLGLPPTDPRARKLALKSVIAFAEHSVDFLRSYRMTTSELLQLTTSIDGYPHFKAMHEMGRGGVMITAHFGNWEWCGGLVSLDHTTHAVAETFTSRAITGFLDHVRARKNLRSIQLGSAAREILRVLRRGEYVAILADRPTPDKGVRVKFFGRSTRVPEGAAALALRAGSPLLVGGLIRNSDGTYSAYGWPPIMVDPQQPKDQAIQQAMQRVMNDLETLIRKAPEQWYMFRPMWPTTPS